MFCCKRKSQNDVQLPQDDVSDDILGKVRDDKLQAEEDNLENRADTHVG